MDKKVAVDMERIRELLENGEYGVGFCIECGEEDGGIEPDARKYHCEACGADAVYGAEQILLEFA